MGDAVIGNGEAEIPIIDAQKLLIDSHEESAHLHVACQEWGFFQVNLPTFTSCSFVLLNNF